MTQHINLHLSSGQHVMALPLGEEAPKYSGGNAVWTVVPRPRRKGFTDYEGTEPWRCKLKVMFNQWPGGDVEPLIRILEERMIRPDNRAEPDLLSLRGPAMAHSELVWVLEDIDDSGQALRRDDGRRCRQELVLTFLEYVSVELVVQAPSPAAAAQERAAAPAGSVAPGVPGRTYTVRSGDTLSGIAARELGSASKWQTLADKNGVRDPKKLRVGQVLTLP